MSIAVGLLEADSGEVTVLGRRPDRRGICPGLAYVAQHKPLYRGFSVADILLFGEKTNTTWDRAYASRLVAEAQIPLSARVKTLSPGHRARVALAVALGRRPDVLLLDEPLAELDPVARRSVVRTLMEDAAERGTTIVLSSHVLSEVAEIADRLIILGAGRVRLSGALDDLLDEHYCSAAPVTRTASSAPARSSSRTSAPTWFEARAPPSPTAGTRRLRTSTTSAWPT